MNASTPTGLAMDALEIYERTARKKYKDGAECPQFTMDLLRLADAIANNASLSSEQEKLQEHLIHCAACRSTVDSAVWFARHPVGMTTEYAAARVGVLGEIKLSNEEIIRKLRDAKKKCGYRVLTFIEYLTELMAGAGIADVGAVVRALDLPRDGGLQSLYLMSKNVIESVSSKLSLHEGFVTLAVEYEAAKPSGAEIPTALALKAKVKQVVSDDPNVVLQPIRDLVSEYCNTDALARERVRECRRVKQG